MKFKMPIKVLNSVASLLLAVAPVLAVKTMCLYYWGEPECPECLKEHN